MLDEKKLRSHDHQGDPSIIEANQRFVASFFPGLEATPFHSESCLYTTTPDYHVLDKVPGTGAPIILAGGGSGHAFKMGPAIGDAGGAGAGAQAAFFFRDVPARPAGASPGLSWIASMAPRWLLINMARRRRSRRAAGSKQSKQIRMRLLVCYRPLAQNQLPSFWLVLAARVHITCAVRAACGV